MGLICLFGMLRKIDFFCYRETHECIKNWFLRPFYWLFVWSQFTSTVNIRGNLHFETRPVILFQDEVFDNKGLRFLCRVEIQLKITILQNIDGNNWWKFKIHACFFFFNFTFNLRITCYQRTNHNFLLRFSPKFFDIVCC